MLTHAKADPDLHARALARGFSITPATSQIGAEIRGLNLEKPLAAVDAQLLREAWLTHKVIFFRDTDISHEAHIRLGRQFGDLEGHPVIPHVPGHPEILSIRGVEGVKPTPETIEGFKSFNKWHTDVTFREKPSIASLLRARILPDVGGDTLFADTAAAYRGLPQAVKERIDGLDAEHDIVRSFGSRVSDEKREQLGRDFPPVRHPVVRRHPETGEKILYVNYTFTSRILDIEPAESDQLLRLLFDRIKVPEYQLRFVWSPNALVIWDNRSTQHYAVGDYFPADRLLERVTVSGDVVRR